MSNTASEAILQLALVVPVTEAEGPGRRFAVWLQGCPLRCPGCCNPEMLSFSGGRPTTLSDLVAQLDTVRGQIEGITLLGGEPFSHAAGAAAFAAVAQERGLTVMIFSGHTLVELRANPDNEVRRLLNLTDILVDGPYDRDQPETARRWVGSRNQQVHFLTPRVQVEDSRWRQPNTIEVRLVNGEVTINGFPARSAAGLWKRQ